MTRPIPSRMFVTTEDARVKPDLVLLNGGGTSRNRDWGSGKSIRLVPDGIRTDSFDANPLVLYMHNSYIPLGKSRVFKAEGKLWGDRISFHRKRVPVPPGWSDGMSKFDTALIADLWDEGWIKGASVQLNYTDDDIRNFTETEDELVIPTSELVEWTVYTIPAERASLKQRFEALGVPAQFADMLPVASGSVPDLVVVRPPNIILPKEYRMDETETTPEQVIPVSETDIAAFGSFVATHIMGNEDLLKKFAAAIQPHLSPAAAPAGRTFRFEFPKQETPANTPIETVIAQTDKQRTGEQMTPAEFAKHARTIAAGLTFNNGGK